MKTKQAISYLLFSAMAEIMVSQYENTHMLRVYDPALETKIRNLKANFERVSKQAHVLFTEDEQLIFFDLINVFESLLDHASNYGSFNDLMLLIKSWQSGDITMINSKEELKEVANQI